MIAYNNVKINSTFKKNFFNDVLPQMVTDLPSHSHLGIIRKTATTIERSVI